MIRVIGRRDAKLLHINARQLCDLRAPRLGWKVNVLGPNQISNQAALMCGGHALPPCVEVALQQFRLVE